MELFDKINLKFFWKINVPDNQENFKKENWVGICPGKY